METIIGNKAFGNHTYIMGILNVTPDSFSDGGQFVAPDAALAQAERLINGGADIIDIGGESIRPGYTRISAEEEIARVSPVIEAVKSRFDIPVSIDTYKSAVAKAAVEAGADMVNDIWGLKHDADMAKLIAESGVSCCLMHNREKAEYSSFIDDVISDLQKSVELAKSAGIADNRIILDPGIGFAKTLEQNLELTNKLEKLHELGYPLLLGASRKSMIGHTLRLPVDERIEGTIVTTVMAVIKGCRFVRVHDVTANRRAVQMTEAILNAE